MTMWETVLATIPATAVSITVLVIVAKGLNTCIDDTNKRIDDLREIMLMILGKLLSEEELQKIKYRTGTDN